MLCGGKVTVFFECNIPKSYLYIFGGGHIAQALLKIIDKQRFEVVIIDNRKEYAVKEVQKKADRVILSDFDEYSKQFKPSDSSFAVIITHGHNRDYEVLKNIYKRRLKFKYVGMIGSTKKVFLEIKRLKAELGDVDLSNLYSPVGLSIGGKSPYEIALSIAAEIQSVIYNKNNIHNMLDYKEI